MTLSPDRGLALVQAYGSAEKWLAVLVTTRPDGQPGVSVVNAGITAHPVTGQPVVAFVARGATAKLTNLRHLPRATLVFRSGWEWVAVRGSVQLAGPDDPLPGLGSEAGRPEEALRLLLRDIYAAAGGHHDDLDGYDRAMAAERRTAVLVQPDHFTSNPPGTEHQEHG